MASHPDRGRRWGVPLAALDPVASLTGPPMAGLDLQVQTDRYCIYQVWFLFFCFIPDTLLSHSWKT